MDPIERFFTHVDATGDCWQWTGCLTDEGYGQTIGGGAHRRAWRLLVGEPPKGMHLDHRCRNRACVNPDHLELVMPRVNYERSAHPAWITRRTGICQRGHAMTEKNTIRTKRGGQCRECQNAAARRRKAAIKEKP
jgi:hypothetical protein